MTAMEKISVFGLPMNPMPLLEQLAGKSFCVSYGTRDKLGRQLDDAIRLVGAVESSILLVDNGAFSAHQAGVNTMTDEAYLQGFANWANEISERCPQAIVVLPDVIGGTCEQNWQLASETMSMFDAADRLMPIYHLDEPIHYFLNLCETFNYVGIGSAGQYFNINGKAWHARMTEIFAALDKWEAESNGAFIRPRLHLMRAQSKAHLFPVDSSDSVNVSMNHNRQRKVAGETVAQFAARIDDKIQASAGPAAEHQVKRPLDTLQACTTSFAAGFLTELGFEVSFIGEDGEEDEAECDRLVAEGLARCREMGLIQPSRPLDVLQVAAMADQLGYWPGEKPKAANYDIGEGLDIPAFLQREAA
jgi:hypothetical protein